MAAPGLAAPDLADAWSYRVRPGDNLFDLTRQYLRPQIGWKRLQHLNRVQDPLRLEPHSELRMPVAWLQPQAGVASIVFVKGKVTRLAEGTGEEKLLAVGDELSAGDSLVSATDAEATLRLADGSRVLVGGGSRLRVDRLLVLGASGVVDADLQLDEGEADTRVTPNPGGAPRFRVKTPQLTLGVRGTDFRVRADGGSAFAEVTQGRVAAQLPAAGAAGRSSARRGAVLDAGEGVRRDEGQAGPLRPQPLAAAPDLAALPALIERLPLDFAWPAVGGAGGAGAVGADAYRAQVFADAGLERRLLDDRFATPRARWADLPDGRYVLQVRGIDGSGLEGRSARHVFELNARPEAPFSSRPAPDSRVHGEAARLAWARSPAAARYRLQVAATADFAAPLAVDRDDLRDTEDEVALAPGRWHWRLASIAPDGEQGPWGDAVGFELRPVPASPDQVEPSTGAAGDRVFRWVSRHAGDRYDVQLAESGDPGDPGAFSAPLVERRVDAPAVSFDALAPGRYAMRVRTVDEEGFAGPYGTPQTFEVPHPFPLWRFLPVLGTLLLIL